MALTVEDVYEYVGIEAEYADVIQNRRAMRALSAAKMWLKGAVGRRRDLRHPYDWMEWPLAEETILMAAGEMYENRTLSDVNLSKYAGSKAAASLNRLAFDAIFQLKYSDALTMRRCCCGKGEPPEESPGEDHREEEPPSEDGGDGGCPSETP